MHGCETEESPRYLSVENIIAINKEALAVTPDEPFGVIKPEQLGSAQARPAVKRFYEQNGDIFFLSAVLFISLVQAHAFFNANKRTAFLSAQTFLRINGYDFMPLEDDAIEIATHVATGTPDYLDEELLSSWFKSYSSLIEDNE